ncbi:MAG: hypothetical protein JOZ72_02680 [Alphaproteobacteria bacterium]|nr:hypothetical protein [Alphaproteobacteria bacterium]
MTKVNGTSRALFRLGSGVLSGVSWRWGNMSHLVIGTGCGVMFGLLAVGLMLPMEFPDKRAALLGAFLNRLSIGVAIGAGVNGAGWPGWMVGLMFGVLISAGDAVITKAYVPILGLGAVGGAVIGFVVAMWGG